jgi:beta-mannanase
VLFGASTDESSFTSFAKLDELESHAGKQVSMYVLYKSFYWDPDFPTAQANAVVAKGMMPFMTWEPFNPSNGTDQPEYALARIAGGNFDPMINRWAQQIKAWNHPMYLRFAAEMNGDWFPWSIGINGNSSGDYINAWRHVHDIFAANGVSNVKWVWNPNVNGAQRVALASVYPGDGYVDMVGIDGYNWGTSASWASWQSPTSVFGSTLNEVRAITRRPVMIGETSSAEAGGSKAQWIDEFFSFLKANQDIRAFVWFNYNKETDWRIESSSGAQAAFARGISDPRYV